jgi:hypothetical protein
MKALMAMLLAVCCGCSAASASDEAALGVLTPSSSDKATVEQHRDTDGSYHIVIGGERYDGRRLIKAFITQLGALDGAGWPRDATIAVDVATFSGFGDEAFGGLSLRLATLAGRIHQFVATAVVGGHFAGALSEASDGQQRITLEADNAGAFLRAIGLYGRISGGHLSLTLNLPSDAVQPPAGELTLRDYAVADEPLFEPIRAKGVAETRFSRMQLSFRLLPGRLAIDRGFACGVSQATEIRGIVDLSKSQIDIDGRLLFAFGNKLLSELPREDSADMPVFMNYRTRGAIDAPQVQVNHAIPVVLARSLLRSCFDPQPQAR